MPLTPEREAEITRRNMTRDDCGVTCLTTLLGWPRQQALAALLGNGYEPGRGTARGSIERALRAAGVRTREMDLDGSYDTAATFANEHEYGTFIVYIENHVMALQDGVLHNSRGFWHSRVTEVSEVVG